MKQGKGMELEAGLNLYSGNSGNSVNSASDNLSLDNAKASI